MIRETTGSKILLIVWKNTLLLKSRPIATTFCVIWPLLIGFILIGMRYFSTIEDNEYSTFEKIDIDQFDDKYHGYLQDEHTLMKLAYVPKNKILDKIVNITTQKLGLDGYIGLEDYDIFIETLILENYFAGIYFNTNGKNIDDYPKIFNFSLVFPRELRSSEEQTWKTDKLFVISVQRGPRNGFTPDGGSPIGYYREGFLPLQQTLSMTYIDLVIKKHSKKRKSKTLPKIYMQRYPYPKFQEDYLLKKLIIYYPVIAALAVLLPITQMVADISAENESGLKDVMKIMGISNWIHWLGWFMSAFAVTGFGIIIMIIALKLDWMENPPVLIYSDPSALLLFFLLYIANMICFSFMMAVLVNAKIAGAVFLVVSILTFLPFQLCVNINEQLSIMDKLLISLIPNIAVGYGCTVIIEHELDGIGLIWNNIFSSTVEGDGMTVGYIMLMMCLSSVCYFIIAMYVEQISSNDFGQGRKWYFPVSKEFWFDQKLTSNDVDDIDNRYLNPNAFETEPINKRIGVMMQNVTKKCSHKNAVYNLSLNMYYSEITVLLGQTDKSTIMGLLNGQIRPTNGRIFINGFNIEKQIGEIQQILGICPRKNILFQSLSVVNNLRFFCRLKGLKGTTLDREVDKFVRKLNLEHHINERVKKLSPSIKRKLCMCCALCGNAKVVLCDEPSYGLDSSARRSLWDIIQSEKSSRVILIFTDLIEEADVLADRMAFLCKGKLICYGSQFFLKRKFCGGYKLVCIKDEHCDSSVVLETLSKHLPNITITSDLDNELTFFLPESNIALYPRMLNELQRNLDILKIIKFSIHISTLEEIFLKANLESKNNQTDYTVISEFENEKNQKNHKNRKFKKHLKKNETVLTKTYSETDSFDFNTFGKFIPLNIIYDHSKHTKANQFLAMLYKSILHTYRNKLHIIGMYLLYILMVVAAIITASRIVNEPRHLNFEMQQYAEPIIFYQKSADINDSTFMDLIVSEYISKSLYKNVALSVYEIPLDTTVNDFLKKLSVLNLARVETHFIAGATFENNSIIAWLNNEPLHTAPLTINLVHNALLRTSLNESYEIVVSLLTLPVTETHILTHLDANLKFGGFLPVYTNIGWSVLTAYFVMFAIKERINFAKMVQMVHGMNAIIFWLARLLWDLIILLILTFICNLLAWIPLEIGFRYLVEILEYFLFSVYFCFCVLPFMYFLSFFFQSPSMGFIIVMSINMSLGVLVFFFFWLFNLNGEDNFIFQFMNIFDLFRVYPLFSYVTGLLNIYKINIVYSVCTLTGDYYKIYKSKNNCESQVCCDLPHILQYKRPGILRELIYLTIVAICSFLTIVLMDNATIATTCLRFRELLSHNELPVRALDADVERLKQQIAAMHLQDIKNRPLVVDRVTKFYGRVLSVKGVSFLINAKECFGLVGASGAGKTSIIRMLMAKENISAGYIYIQGENIITNIDYLYRHVGYCPQKNPLIDELTGRETIKIICLISGIANHSIVNVINNISEAFGLQKYLDTQIKNYNVAYKRRLSVALAIIGNPSVIFLDEPTRSIDPVACWRIWNVLHTLREQGKAILICTKNMEECNAVCNSVAVIVNGEFKCFGSIFHLKNKFSRGIILKIKVSEKQLSRSKRSSILLSQSALSSAGAMMNIEYSVNRIKKFVEKKFDRAVLRDEHRDVLVYYIPLEDVNWSRIFSIFEKKRVKLNIEDYMLSQISLNEILAEFSQYQREIFQKRKSRFK